MWSAGEGPVSACDPRITTCPDGVIMNGGPEIIPEEEKPPVGSDNNATKALLTAANGAAVASFTGECAATDPTVGTIFAPDAAHPWTAAEAAAFLDEYYPCDGAGDAMAVAKCMGTRPFAFHLGSTPGQLCWKLPQNPDANRVLASRIDETCKEKVFTAEDGKEKCDALEAYAEAHASTPSFFSMEGLAYYGMEALKWLGIGVPGAILAGWGFHVGYEIYKGRGEKNPLDKTSPGASAKGALDGKLPKELGRIAEIATKWNDPRITEVLERMGSETLTDGAPRAKAEAILRLLGDASPQVRDFGIKMAEAAYPRGGAAAGTAQSPAAPAAEAALAARPAALSAEALRAAAEGTRPEEVAREAARTAARDSAVRPAAREIMRTRLGMPRGR